MIKILLLTLILFSISLGANAQCDSTDVPSNYSISSDLIMSGAYVVNGTFTLSAGATITVESYLDGGCGELKIYADEIIIEGNIIGDYAGYEGGTGGTTGLDVTSTTGNETSLTACDSPDDVGQIAVQNGLAGSNGMGPGAGVAGMNGEPGTGTKQYCGNTDDNPGVIGGAGGAGGGSGGSYGGIGNSGSAGADGSESIVQSGLSVESSYPIVGGNGGNGGAVVSSYGTSSGRDIELGSGGAGSGGGGRSFYLGTNGENGGTGGGLVFLRALNSLEVSGTISVKGNNGGDGGNGGSGDATADCCSDPCNGCDERTFSSGSGGGSGAGGGSGGGIFLESYGPALISGTLDVSGGNGGDGGNAGTGVTCTYSDFFCGDQDITTGQADLSDEGGAGSGGRIKIYVSDCSNLNFNGTTAINGGTGNGIAGDGTYEEVCGYLGLEEGEIAIGWTIYPNPTVDQITIEVLSGVDFWETNTLEVFNALGQKVVSTSLLGKKTIVDMSSHPSGFYTVRIITGNKIEIKKVLKK